MVALAAVELSTNCVTPPGARKTTAPLLLIVALPAVGVVEMCEAAAYAEDRAEVGKGCPVPSSRIAVESYLSEIAGPTRSGHEVLYGPGIVRDPCAADGEGQAWARSNSAGIRGRHSESYAVNLGVHRNRDILVIGKSQSRCVADPFGTVIGVQLAAVFQLPELGLRSH